MTYFLWIIGQCKLSGIDFNLDMPRRFINGCDRQALAIEDDRHTEICDNWYGSNRV